jgi:hypothetical protein
LPQPFSNGLQPFISEIWKSFYHWLEGFVIFQ